MSPEEEVNMAGVKADETASKVRAQIALLRESGQLISESLKRYEENMAAEQSAQGQLEVALSRIFQIEKTNEELRRENADLQEEVASLRERTAELEDLNAQLGELSEKARELFRT